MMVATLTWPDALVGSVAVAALGLVLSVLIWQFFGIAREDARREGSSVSRRGDDET